MKELLTVDNCKGGGDAAALWQASLPFTHAHGSRNSIYKVVWVLVFFFEQHTLQDSSCEEQLSPELTQGLGQSTN